MIKWRPRFVFDAGDLTLSLPTRPYIYAPSSVGGAHRSAGGVIGAYTVRYDEILHLPLRFFESEWSALHAFIRWAQGGDDFTWYPDAAVPLVSYTVDLEAPQSGTSFSPTRDGTYGRALELTITLRNRDNAPFDIAYFPITNPNGLMWGP